MLGPPAVACGGRPAAVPRRQVRALLHRLVTDLKPVRREQLGFLFWPDIPDAVARRNWSRARALNQGGRS
jgi:DNA-binding SARP family transcriptional activator